jgi:DNA repair protein SbcD/Mre11
MNAVIFGDVHLGSYRYPIRDHIVNSLEQIVAYVRDKEPEKVIFVGDAFRTNVPSSKDIATFGGYLSRMTFYCNEVVLIPGNHDLAGGATTLDVYGIHPKIKVVTSPGVVEGDGYEIFYVPYISARPGYTENGTGDNSGAIRTLLDIYKSSAGDGERFLVSHCTMLGTRYDSGASSVLGNEVLWTDEMFDGFKASFLGHLHRPQSIGAAYYTGSICPLGFSETEPKSFIDYVNQEILRVPIRTPRFVTVPYEDLHTVQQGPDLFIRVICSDNNKFTDFECAYYEVIPPREERTYRARIGESHAMSLKEGLKRWLELNEKDNADEVLELAGELCADL